MITFSNKLQFNDSKSKEYNQITTGLKYLCSSSVNHGVTFFNEDNTFDNIELKDDGRVFYNNERIYYNCNDCVACTTCNVCYNCHDKCNSCDSCRDSCYSCRNCNAGCYVCHGCNGCDGCHGGCQGCTGCYNECADCTGSYCASGAGCSVGHEISVGPGDLGPIGL